MWLQNASSWWFCRVTQPWRTPQIPTWMENYCWQWEFCHLLPRTTYHGLIHSLEVMMVVCTLCFSFFVNCILYGEMYLTWIFDKGTNDLRKHRIIHKGTSKYAINQETWFSNLFVAYQICNLSQVTSCFWVWSGLFLYKMFLGMMVSHSSAFRVFFKSATACNKEPGLQLE